MKVLFRVATIQDADSYPCFIMVLFYCCHNAPVVNQRGRRSLVLVVDMISLMNWRKRIPITKIRTPINSSVPKALLTIIELPFNNWLFRGVAVPHRTLLPRGPTQNIWVIYAFKWTQNHDSAKSCRSCRSVYNLSNVHENVSQNLRDIRYKYQQVHTHTPCSWSFERVPALRSQKQVSEETYFANFYSTSVCSLLPTGPQHNQKSTQCGTSSKCVS